MTQEEVKIKLTVDTSGLKTSLNQAKQSFSTIGSNNGVTKATDETNKAIQNLKKTMDEVRNFSFLDFAVTAMEGLTKSAGKAKNAFTEAFKKAKEYAHGIDYGFDNFRNAFMYGFNSEEWYKSVGFKEMPSLKRRFEEFFGFTAMGFKDLGKSISTLVGGVGSSFKALGAGITAALGPVGLAIAAITISLGIVAAQIAVVVKACKNALTVAKEIKALTTEANKINMSVKAYQEWGYVMKQCGIEASKLTDFVKKLTEKQKETLNGSAEVIGAFNELGMSQEQVVSMGSEELFAETVKRLQQVENATERTSIAYRIFTDDAVQLNSVLQLTNDETNSLINSYYALGAAPTDSLIEKSGILTASTTNLSYAWQGLKNTLGEWVMPAITKVVQWLTTAVAYLNVFLKGLFGIELFTSKSTAQGGTIGDNYGKGFQNATKEAEKFKRFTMGFDELNVIPDTTGSSASGGDSSTNYGIGGGNFSADIPIIEVPDTSAFAAWVEKYKTIIQDVATWSLIIIGILMTVYGFMGGGIPMALIGIGLAGLGIAIGATNDGPFERLWEGIKKIGAAIKDWWNTNWAPVFTKAFWEDQWQQICDAWNKSIQDIKDDFANTWNAIKNWWNTYCAKYFTGQYWSGVWENIKKAFKTGLEAVKQFFVNIWNGIKETWSKVATWFDDKVIQPVVNFFTGMWEGLKNGASAAWEGIKSVFSSVTNWFKNVFTEAWEGVKNVFSTGGKIFDGIKEGISDVFKTVVNGLIGGINKVISVPFNAINSLLNKIRNVSVAGIEPFKDLIRYNALSVPQIPKLATGGIAISSTLANIGEAGKEAVLPLENNTGWMDILADKIAGRTPQAPTKVVLKVGERELGYATINSINGITRQTGELPLVFA